MSELTDAKIKTLVNQFVRTGMEFGSLKDGEGGHIALYQREDSWEIVAQPKYYRCEEKPVAKFDFPKLEGEEEIDQAIELAGYLSVKLRNHMIAKKSASGHSGSSYAKMSEMGVKARRDRRRLAVENWGKVKKV